MILDYLLIKPMDLKYKMSIWCPRGNSTMAARDLLTHALWHPLQQNTPEMPLLGQSLGSNYTMPAELHNRITSACLLWQQKWSLFIDILLDLTLIFLPLPPKYSRAPEDISMFPFSWISLVLCWGWGSEASNDRGWMWSSSLHNILVTGLCALSPLSVSAFCELRAPGSHLCPQLRRHVCAVACWPCVKWAHAKERRGQGSGQRAEIH